MAEVSIIVAAIAKLEADTQRVRGEGLEDLKRVLGQEKVASKLDGLEDDIFHKILELLYKIFYKEKPAFLRATKPTTKNNAASRLEVAAAAFRLVVETGAPRMTFKTALSVLDHIADTLPLADGTFCEPLKADYLKSFKTILEYAPHTEHLRTKQWQSYVDFALSSLSTGLEDDPNGDGLLSSRDPSTASRNGHQQSLRLSQRSGRSAGRDVASHASDFVAALRSLTSTTNAPVMSRSEAIAETLLTLLQTATRAQEVTFETLNNIIFVSLTENVTFTLSLLSRLIPITRRLWSTRSALLKEQMLVTLFTCRQLFLTTREPWPSLDKESLQALLDKLWSEYRARSERDILQFDDMLIAKPGQLLPLQLRQFVPLRDSGKALSCWMTLSIIACLILRMSDEYQATPPAELPEDTPRKRQKVQVPFDEVLDIARLGLGQEKLVALQIILFLFDQPQPTALASLGGLSSLLHDLRHEDVNIRSWTFLVFSRLLLCDTSSIKVASGVWLEVWESARRALSVPACARAACHTLNTILQTRILGLTMTGGLVDAAFFGGGNNGPSILTDTALDMFATTLRLNIFDDDRRFETFCLKILGWLSLQWTLPSNLDRLHNAHVASHAHAELLYSLFVSMCGTFDSTCSRQDWSPSHPLWRMSLLPSNDVEFLHFLLGLPSREDQIIRWSRSDIYHIDPLVRSRLTRSVLEFLSGRLTDFIQAWESIYAERSSNITNDIVAILAVASTVASAVWTRCSKLVHESRPDVLYSKSRDTFEGFVGGQSGDSFRYVATRICECVIGLYTQLAHTDAEVSFEEYKLVIESALRLTIEGQPSSKTNEPSDFDFLDAEVWDSQTSQRSQTSITSNAMRLDLWLCPDSSALLAKYRLELITALQSVKSRGALDPAPSSVIVNEILSLDSTSLLAARGAVEDFLSLRPGIARDDAQSLLSYIAERFLQDEAYERCEAALVFCLKVMRGLIELWSSPGEDDDLTGIALDIYYWFLNIALGKGIAGPRVLSVMAELVDVLLEKNASFGGEDLPSPRTTLLQILEVSNAAKKYQVAGKLLRIFEKYIATQHEAIFDDVLENLPSDPDKKEGIAVRLYVVAALGARWHTVLRQATYHLFETVANVPSTTPLAAVCIAKTCKALDLKQPRQLFKLFAPQIFYTWLSKETLSKVPYRAFEYVSLQDLVFDNIAELVGQISLRGFSHAAELTEVLEQDWKSSLVQEFSFAEAYALSSESSLPKQERLFDGSEKLIRKELGSDLYVRLLRENLPDIISRLIISLQDDRGIDKMLEKNQYNAALDAWNEMHSASNSGTQLPFAQQPSFRARCLLDELNYLYQRLELQAGEVWTSALLIHVYRQLLDNAEAALGPLHICSIIRKIRIAISLAGPVALQGYPLEMLLHSLRPYLTLFDCAEDTMGIYKYLLNHGKPFLSGDLSFVAGLGVAVFASLVGFITSSQDSTTQESHFLSTMTKAQDFRAFLGHYLESLNPSETSEEQRTTFGSLMQHAKAITAAGNSSKSTSEGSLLYVLLSDRGTRSPLLTDLHFDLAIQILCRDFVPTTDPADDILGDDNDAENFSRTLKTVIRRLDLNQSFLLWATEAIGRSHVMQGLVFNASSEKSAEYPAEIAPAGQDQEAIQSYTSILKYLADMVWKSSLAESASAERTLQLIFSALDKRSQDAVLQPDFNRSFVQDLRFKNFPCPPIRYSRGLEMSSISTKECEVWAADLLQDMCQAATHDPVLSFLEPLLSTIPSSADVLLPYTVHLVLLHEVNGQPLWKDRLSREFSKVLSINTKSSKKACRLSLRTLLYLQKCRHPNESNLAQRNAWLEVDFGDAAIAAAECQMWHEALLLAEIQQTQAQLQSRRSSRKSFALTDVMPDDVVSKIYENVDDPDFFYGKREDLDLTAVISKMSHEGASQKSLSFHSAMLDSQLRISQQAESLTHVARLTASSLSAANMQGLSEAVRKHYEYVDNIAPDKKGSDSGLLGQGWDIQPAEEHALSLSNMASFLRSLHGNLNREILISELDDSFLALGTAIKSGLSDKKRTGDILSQLAVFAETKQIIQATTSEGLELAWAAIEERNKRTRLTEFERLSPILIGREATFAAIRRNNNLQTTSILNSHQALLNEIRAVRGSLEVASHYEAPQFCLNRTMYLSELSQVAIQTGLKIDVAVQYDLARTLWAQDETSAGIGILQKLKDRDDTAKQAIAVTKAEILTDLGHKVAEARLEKPDEIIAKYFVPSFKELHGRGTGSDAGRVFHNFAVFCDTQLQDTDNLDDFTRISKIRDRKLAEVHELEQLIKSRDKNESKTLSIHLQRAKTWFKLDEQEWQRVQKNREDLILNCLENYMLSMKASDDYASDTLRFVALWLNQAESVTANETVGKHLPTVPSIKFANLVNQLSSRLQDTINHFQKLLMNLMFRICSDHPYHSLYQLFAASKSKGQKQDEVAVSRNAAALKLAEMVNKKSPSAAIWIAIHNSSIAYHRVALDRVSEKNVKTGAKIQLRQLPSGQKLERALTESTTKIPPPTLNIQLRTDRDYSHLPTFSHFDQQISIAGGISAPKIVTIIASDGSRHKMLLKGGNDDLRQDAIMEQVFQQVSDLLRDHRATRQRNLGIRTYKVIPLTTNTGIIEFVKDTKPLHDYLLPAHERYFPKDFKPTRCRKDIGDAQTKPLDQRIHAYRTVTTNFHPVMRFFFMENFPDPDDWFYKRLNYSRSTAAISILGHVLGLGDRHGHNILLDEKSGEVVHIDLGVAFEAGRILPIPEVVPFRLTRDLVDGMGLTGVEGVFRRCCNFTLEALRREQEAIMTILDVLRYDPLHSWSISPLRLAKMQENNEQAEAAAGASMVSGVGLAGGDPIGIASRRDANEPSEADRALTIVAKKLGKALSVEATVNELIRQATDERNLAVLYCGWAAYA
ncbi:Serine/threonine-protein kinase tel1 [Exophiala sideris]|uniref:Serine/threonine-protein kinase Tel1 n=1 Tax=Exophiala sideris TaxID=1016849 RepID=A0ABR0J1W5_9EURO|nr:Serine/threonine-protein kinase tel1 [Exophiala sideris]KAK5030824.1 Serine/threonine-protein kinase tel1 [Exophiala sideris]KAK5054366.1 Serine/threonine-protein kinase tel1 [Exophiala sideris]KAK5179766.1 Serine/threonine-protein kinase tel1 [Eurotiomycetes sp. CCFEE 6388]